MAHKYSPILRRALEHGLCKNLPVRILQYTNLWVCRRTMDLADDAVIDMSSTILGL
jgi:hypothetical protein